MPARLSAAAQRSRQLKLGNRRIDNTRPKKAPVGWAQLDVQEPGLPVDDLDGLSPESRAKLKRQAKDELLFRIRGNKEPVKLSQTFDEAAQDLGFDDAKEREVLLKVVFGYAMDHYRTPKAQKELSQLKHSVLRVLVDEDHTSPFEIRVHDPETWGRRSNSSLTSRISELGHLDKINDPVPVKTHQEQDDEHTNGVPFTYYYLTEEFKKQLIKDAVAWDAERAEDAQLSRETHERVIGLG
jgi:hypothetical protein